MIDAKSRRSNRTIKLNHVTRNKRVTTLASFILYLGCFGTESSAVSDFKPPSEEHRAESSGHTSSKVLTLSSAIADFKTSFEEHRAESSGHTSSKVLTLDLHPSSSLEHSNRRRSRSRRLGNTNESSPDLYQPAVEWFDKRKNAIYATIPDREDPQFADDDQLRQFYRFRHLSRYEIQYREQHGLDLHLDWDGIYQFDAESELRNRTKHRRAHAIRSGLADLTPELNTSAALNSYQAVPLSQGYGTHILNIWVGHPVPQRKTVIVDTGSHYTAFPCTGCVGCGAPHHTDPYYDPSKSKTFHQLLCDECQDGVMCDQGKCTFSQSYTEGSSWEAVQVRDLIYCGGGEVLDSVSPNNERYQLSFMYGCQIKVTGLFQTQLADGIAGFSAHPATLPKKMHEAGLIEHNMFAMCFRRELGTSKRGVTAGSLTIGGVSTNLDTSPIVYAKNLAKVGWYTVYVKNIYVRVGGGQSANSVDNDHRTIKVVIDRATLNSGKGVIVDSGTTDTYLHKNVAKEFNKAWLQATGQAYSHQPIALTTEQLHGLPTVLIQCMADNSQQDPSVGGDYASIPGYAGNLDVYSPNDLLIAIPATSYMDYSPITKRYMSRLYFTESAGGVLGSNTMQGHNVVFDWEHGRVGFAESSCTYDKKHVPEAALDEGYLTDCQVGDPILSQPCVNSVDKEMCRHNPSNIALLGNEIWSAVVESPGTSEGISCAEAAKGAKREGDFNSPVTTCNGTGVCQESRPCQLTCQQLAKATAVEPLSLLEQSRCGDTFWSACDYACFQTKLLTVAHSDGHCHEVGRETRTCHTGACARSDPCRVPYLVHAVLGFEGGDVSKWTPVSEQVLATALVNSAITLSRAPLFEAGDIHVSAAMPWSTGDSGAVVPPDDPSIENRESGDLGVKVVVEISIYNTNLDSKTVPVKDEDVGAGSLGSTLRNITDRLRGIDQKSSCQSKDLYDAAKHALTIRKDYLLNRRFFSVLLNELEGTTATEIWPFGNGESGSVLSAWTVRTTIDQDDEINYFGPRKSFMMRFFAFLHGATLVCTAVLLLMTLWSFISAVIDMVAGASDDSPWRLLAWNRRQREYTPVAVEDENAVEASILMGTSPSERRIPASKSRLKKRVRSPNGED